MIVRTLPNPEEKSGWHYGIGHKAAFFTIEAARFIRDLAVQHLIVDLPSIDRPQDEGKLTVHRIFWEITLGSHQLGRKDTSQRTVTELAFIPNEAEDGLYLLNLGLPRFKSDAAPSRIRITPLVTKS